MKEQTVYREKTYVCGEYLDVYIYPVYKQPGWRSGRAKPSTETQQKLNARHSAEQLVRLLNTNFRPEDLSRGLDYAENPEDERQARRDIQNFIRRLRRLLAKRGLPQLKYITVTERSGSGRYHHHIVVNAGIDRDELEALWGFGHANTKRLQFNEKGIADLGHYIVKSPIFRKRWNASKNLVDPEPKTNDSQIRYCWYWNKNMATGFAFAKHQPLRCVEEVCVFYKRAPTYNPQGIIILDKPILNRGKHIPPHGDSIYRKDGSLSKDTETRITHYPRQILEIKCERGLHPTQKPVALFEYLIRTYTNPGELVLDNCMGSGTTAVACIQSGRNFTGFETNPQYFQVATDRIMQNHQLRCPVEAGDF